MAVARDELFVYTPPYQTGPLKIEFAPYVAGQIRKTTSAQPVKSAFTGDTLNKPLMSFRLALPPNPTEPQRRETYKVLGGKSVACQPFYMLGERLARMMDTTKDPSVRMNFTGVQITQGSVHDGTNTFFANARHAAHQISTDEMIPLDANATGVFFMHPSTHLWLDSHPATELGAIMWKSYDLLNILIFFWLVLTLVFISFPPSGIDVLRTMPLRFVWSL